MMQLLWKTVSGSSSNSSTQSSQYDPAILKRNENTSTEELVQECSFGSIIHNDQKGETPKCPSTDEWVNKTRFVYTMEYYSTIKKE